MEVDIVELLVCVASDVLENLSYGQKNLAGDVVGHGHKSNKSRSCQMLRMLEVKIWSLVMRYWSLSYFCVVIMFMFDLITNVTRSWLPIRRRDTKSWNAMAHDEFYVTYAKKAGFATKIRTTTFDKITKAPVNQAIHCNCDGIRESHVKAPMQKNTISAAGCKARIYVKFDKDVDLTHSHPCSPRKAVHYHEYRKLTMHAKCVIEDNDEAGIRPNKTFLALSNEAGGPSNLGFSEKDLRNYITARLRTSNVNADIREMMSYFMRMKDINPNFFYEVKLDEECKFKSVVWVDARCRASYEYYGDVVSVDSTYSTNRYIVVKLVFFPFLDKTLFDRDWHFLLLVGFSGKHGLPFVFCWVIKKS
ncbi:hypothetical protein Ahy_B07g086586 [Arachis hypogaea]|uniref:FAR1 domain-containing protein n=1 Tax=Arachis hypogaea TaxID=3818 RepID=A0A444YA27_ARAHY|nr:hypothetical protein Ahy_B07g086586 [Arachis hypogaea]